MYYQAINSPVGRIEILANDQAITEIRFAEQNEAEGNNHPSTLTEQAADQLQSYFNGQLVQFDLPLAPQGSAFQQSVWQALCSIPYGETTSYGQLAAHIDRPKAARAVGAANGANPIAIIIPCHRVNGSQGQLTGYAGGLPRKQFLLQLEAGAQH